jgi:hypothetical protein
MNVIFSCDVSYMLTKRTDELTAYWTLATFTDQLCSTEEEDRKLTTGFSLKKWNILTVSLSARDW